MLPGKTYSPDDWAAAIWRRKWLLFVPAVLIALTTAIVSLLLPDRYLSETLILVVPQQVPESYVRSTVTTKIDDRLRSIHQLIVSRTRLEKVVRDLKLYPREVARLPMEDVIEKMRRDVRVDIVRGDAFRVAYTSDSPKKAMEVADRLATMFTDESMQDRQLFAESTTDFLQAQLEAARARLTEQERKVAEFQRLHAGELPSERDSNLQVLNNLQLQVQALSESLNRDRDRRLFLEQSVAGFEADAKLIKTTSAQAMPPDAPAQIAAGGTTAEQLASAKESLKSLELRLKPGHPDVAYMKRVVRDLETKLKAEEASQQAAAAASGDTSATPRGRPLTPEEAAALRKLQDTRQELAAVESQIAAKQAEERRLRDQIGQFQRRVAATPGIEAEFTAMTRDYDTLKSGYQTLLTKQEDSKMAAALEGRQIGEQFKILDRARLPEMPFSPNRLLINLGGIFGGLAVGLSLVMLLETRDKGVRTEADLASVVDVPVLASIPIIATQADRRRRKRRRWLGVAAAAVFFLAMVAGAVYAYKAGLLHAPLWMR